MNKKANQIEDSTLNGPRCPECGSTEIRGDLLTELRFNREGDSMDIFQNNIQLNLYCDYCGASFDSK